jgi:hypothetical protein
LSDDRAVRSALDRVAPSGDDRGALLPTDLFAALGTLPVRSKRSRRASSPSSSDNESLSCERRRSRSRTPSALWPPIAEQLANTLENEEDLPEEVFAVAQKHIAGAGFEPATFGL